MNWTTRTCRRIWLRVIRGARRFRRGVGHVAVTLEQSMICRGFVSGFRRINESAALRYVRRVQRRFLSNRLLSRLILGTSALLVLVAVSYVFFSRVMPERPVVTWTMVNISGSDTLGDAHLLEFENGRNVLIDTGREIRAHQYLIPFLNARGITSLEKVIVTNANRSKAGGVSVLLESGIRIGSINFNLPPQAVCDADDWGCSYEDLQQMQRRW